MLENRRVRSDRRDRRRVATVFCLTVALAASQAAGREPPAGWDAVDPAARGAVLTELARLTGSDSTVLNAFGQAVAISGDTIAVGAPSDDDERGAVYLFTEPAGGWGNGTETAKLTAAAGSPGDRLGQAVAIDGDTVVAGAPNQGSGSGGAAYVFVEPPGGWTDGTETARLIGPSPAERLGSSVAIGGAVIVAGAPERAESMGAVYVFVEPPGGWADGTADGRLTASDGVAVNRLGTSAAIAGTTVAVGAVNRDASRGAVYVFVEPPGGWADGTETAVLTTSDALPGDQLGWSVAIDGDVIAGGAALDDIDHVLQGSVYLFEKPPGGWADGVEIAKLTASDGAESDRLGSSVAISDTFVVAGSPSADVAGAFDQGAAYVYQKGDGGWVSATQTLKLSGSQGGEADALGFGVAIEAATIVAGAPALGTPTREGSAYVFGPGDECSLLPAFDGLEAVVNPSGAACGALALRFSPGAANCGGPLVYNVYRSPVADFEPGPDSLLDACVEPAGFLDATAPQDQRNYYLVRAEDLRGSGSGLCNSGAEDGNQLRWWGFATGSMVDLFDDDMEAGSDKWITRGFGDGPWFLTSADSHSPHNSWFGDDGGFCHKVLYFAVPEDILGNPATLEFYHRYDTEPAYDGGVLEYSLEGNTVWHDILDSSLASRPPPPGVGADRPPPEPPSLPPIPANPDRFLTGGYNSVIAGDHPDIHFRGRRAWSGNSGPEFTRVRVDLADFAGRPVNLRWRLRCNESVNLDGWYLDDVWLFFGTDCGSQIFADGFESGNTEAWDD